MTHPCVLGICGLKNSGKTTLIEGLIPRLRGEGLAIAVVKHDTHGIEVDRAGKDSDRFFQAGADVVLQGPGEEVHRRHGEESGGPGEEADHGCGGEAGGLGGILESLVGRYDLVLVEGHKGTPLPKVWLEKDGGEPRPDGVENTLLELAWGADRSDAVLGLVRERLRGQYEETPLYGCVLIGGGSRRMGEPKHLIRSGGETWAEKVVRLLRGRAAEVVIAGGGVIPDELKDTVRLADVPDVRGPMAGILAAMRWNPRASWLVAACDMPDAGDGAVEWLLAARRPGAWIVMPGVRGDSKEVQPLLAWYDFRSRVLLERATRAGDFSLHRLAKLDKVITPEPPAELQGAWKNINTLEDLQRHEKGLNSKP